MQLSGASAKVGSALLALIRGRVMLKPLYRICLASFLLDFTVMIAFVATPFFVFNQLGGEAFMSGVFSALYMGVYALSSLVSSKVVNLAKNSLGWASGGSSVFIIGMCLMPVFRSPVLCASLSCFAFAGLAFTWPALQSWAGAHPDPKKRTRDIAVFNLSWSLGLTVSPLVSGPLYDHAYWLPFAVLFVAGVIVLALIQSMPSQTEYYGPLVQDDSESSIERCHAGERFLPAAMAAVLSANLSAGAARAVFSRRVDELVAAGGLKLFFEASPPSCLTSFPASKFSWLVFVMSLCTALAFLIMGRYGFWKYKLSWLLWPQVALGIALVVLGFTHSLAVMALCFAVLGLNTGVAFFSALFYCMSNPDKKHARAAINEGMLGIGGFAGSLGAGWLGGQFGTVFPFRWSFAVMAAVILIQYGLSKRPR